MKSLILFILLSAAVYAQELNCKITVNYEGLPTINREILRDFASIIENYLNKTKFTDDIDGERIDCTLDIFFTGAPTETNYNAQVFIGSSRPVYRSPRTSPMLTIMDNNWSFVYERGQSMFRNESVYDPITSFLDFYALVIIGYDMDSFEELGGNPYFSQAMNIVNLGANSRFSNGWQKSTGSYTRVAFVEDLLNEKYRGFRESFFNYHYNGIDIYSTDKLEAQKNIASLVHTLNDMRGKININSILIKSFFDAKHNEIIEYLIDYPEEDIFPLLRRVDPSHTTKYDEAAAKR
jgi:hypothetical protein